MWNEAYKIAGYITNRTPTKRLRQRIFFKMFIKSVLIIAYIYLFSYRAYPLIYKIKKFDKISPRVQIGYLYGYDFTNIFRIQLFIQAKVIRIRDVKFNNNKLYYFSDLELSALRNVEIKKVVKLLKILDIINKLLYKV